MKKGLIAAGIAAAMVAMPIAAFAASYKAVPDSCIITDGTAAVAKTMQAVTDPDWDGISKQALEAAAQPAAPEAPEATTPEPTEPEAVEPEVSQPEATPAPSYGYGYVDSDHDGICDNFVDHNGDGYCDYHGEYCYNTGHAHHNGYGYNSGSGSGSTSDAGSSNGYGSGSSGSSSGSGYGHHGGYGGGHHGGR